MPKRSNSFQSLIGLIESQLAPEGATVIESKMLVDHRTGDRSEVDVVIEFEAGGIPVTIAVECRDHARPQTITWVNELAGKFQHLRVDKVIAVSSSGFSTNAKTALESMGYMALTIEEANASDWSKLAQRDRWVDVILVRHRITTITPIVEPELKGSLLRRIDLDTTPVLPNDDRKALSFRKLATDLFARKYGEIIHGMPKQDRLIVSLQAGLTDMNGKRFMMPLQYKMYRVLGVEVEIEFWEEKHVVDTRHGSYRDAHVATGSHVFDLGPHMTSVDVAFVEQRDKGATLGFKVTYTPKKKGSRG